MSWRLSPEDEARLPVNPKTAELTLVQHPTELRFMFIVTFPDNRRLGVVADEAIGPNERLSTELDGCKRTAIKVVDRLFTTGDEHNLRGLNTNSLMATIQRTIADFNEAADREAAARLAPISRTIQ